MATGLVMARGCGYRVKGGTYLTVPTAPAGRPLESFLLCEPIQVAPEMIGVAARGVTLKLMRGVWHVFDVVGQEYYPNVVDFVEEARRMGVSRRAEGLDYSLLTADSRLFLMHARARIENAADYYAAMSRVERGVFGCPRRHADHRPGTGMCAGLWWHDYARVARRCVEADFDRICGPLHINGSSVLVYQRPSDITPRYRHAIFASFPIGRIEVVRDAATGAHEAKLSKVSQSSLPCGVVEQ